MTTVLGLDLGTQSLKAVFYDAESKNIAAISSSALDVDRDSSGKAEQDASWWLVALQDCMNQVSSEIRQSVKAVAVSGQQHGFVPLDKNGKVLAPVKLWCDTATEPEVRELTEACGGIDRAIALTGNPVLAGYTSPKILWLKNNRPELYQQLAHILLPHDYLNYILTGEYAMEYGDASGTGLLDVRKRQWSTQMLAALDRDRDLSSCLPPLLAEDVIVGEISSAAAEVYGLPVGIPVATGGGDNMMGAIGTGNVSNGELTISLGTSGTLYAYSDSPVIDPQGNIAAFCSSTGGWLPLLCTMNCTQATELIRQPLGISLDEFDALAASVPACADGLVSLPFFSGERTPNLPRATASMHGLNAQNCTREHMLRSMIEATCYSLKLGADTLGNLGMKAKEITLTGGGSKSAVWRQIIADVFSLPVTMLLQEEGAAMGAALQALWIQQKQTNSSLTIKEVCSEHLQKNESLCAEPDAHHASIYEAGYLQYQRILGQMTPLYD